MTPPANDTSIEPDRPLDRLQDGDLGALVEVFQEHRARLQKMVELRIDPRLRGRIDAADILQDGYIDLAKRLESYLADPRLPMFLWMRLVLSDRLAMVHRHYLGTQMRNVAQEVSLYRNPLPEASSAALASMLLGRLTSPLSAAIRAEQTLQVQEAVNALDPIDREVVALRHFEQLTRAETAEVLGMTEEAGAKRYIRALQKLKKILAAMPGGLEGF